MSATSTHLTLGEQLQGIMRRLDAAGDAWTAAGYPYEGPVYDARETVFRDLRAFNDRAR